MHTLQDLIDPTHSAGPAFFFALVCALALLFFILLRTRRVRRSLRARLVTGFLAVALLPLALLAWLDQRVTQETLLKTTRMALYSAATQTAAEIDGRIKDTLDAIRTESLIPDFALFLELPSAQRRGSQLEASAIRLLASLKRRDSVAITSYALLDKTGTNIADTNGIEVGSDKSDRDYFQMPLKTGLPFVSAIAYAPTSKTLSLYFASPVRTTAGDIIGVLRVRYNASIIQQVVFQQSGRIGANSHCLLLDEHYVRIADSTQPETELAPLLPLDAPTRAKLLADRRATTKSLGLEASAPESPASRSEIATLEQHLRQAAQAPFFWATLHPSDREPSQYAIVPLRMQPWYLILGQPKSDFLAATTIQARNAVLLLVVFFAVVGAAALLFARRLAAPILRLEAAARSFASGNLTARVAGETIDEIGNLGCAFNAMAEQLTTTMRGLEQKIEELGVTEAALRQSETNYRSIFSNATEGIFQIDQNNRMLNANPAMAEIFGFETPEEFLVAYNQNAAQFHPENRTPSSFLERVREEGRIVNAEMNVLRRDRKLIWVSINAHLVRSPESATFLIEGACRDISLRKRAVRRLDILNRHLQHTVRERTQRLEQKASELEDANARLTKLDEMKSSFISSVSHELRTPLTSILGFAKLIGKDFASLFLPTCRKDERLTRYGRRIISNTEIIQSEGQRLTRLIGDLLDLSKIESGKLKWYDRECRLEQLIDTAVKSSATLLDLKPDLRLELGIEPDLPSLNLDSDRITQVILNLLHNAIKFTFGGEVRITARRDGKHFVRVSVADSGMGIPAQELSKVFDKFHQVWQGDVGPVKPQGTGLGLSICREIVEHYGGKIWAESTVGQGASFTFTLPTPE